MSNAQLAFGLMSGLVPARPFEPGDVLVKRSGARFVVTHVDRDADTGAVVCCAVNMETGLDAVLLEREIFYRTNL